MMMMTDGGCSVGLWFRELLWSTMVRMMVGSDDEETKNTMHRIKEERALKVSSLNPPISPQEHFSFKN